MSFTLQMRCNLCDQLMRYDAEHLANTGVCEWICWNCEQVVMSSDFRQCLIGRSGNMIDSQEEQQ